MIKLGNNDISLKVGSANVSAAYLGSTQVYGDEGGYDLCYGVADDISTYSARTFADVYDKTSSKWYKLNNLNEYEEYGVYGSGRNITTYAGKLTVDGGVEYKYTGGSWVSIGAVSGSTAELPDVPFSLNYNAKEYDSTTKTFTKTTGQLVDIDAVIANGTPVVHDDYVTVNGGTYAPITGYQTYINRSTSTPNLTIISKQRTADSTNCHLFANRSSTSDYNWMYRPTNTKLAFHGSSQINGTTTTTQPVIESVRVDSSQVIKFDNYTDNTTTSATSFTYGNGSSSSTQMFYGGSSGEYFAGDFYWIYVSQTTLTDEQVQQVIDYNENYSPEVYPEYYTDKSDPADDLTFTTLEEAEAYALVNCVYDGMRALIGGVRYTFDSEEGWVETPKYYLVTDVTPQGASGWTITGSSDYNPDPTYYDDYSIESTSRTGVTRIAKVTIYGYDSFTYYLRSYSYGSSAFVYATYIDELATDPTTNFGYNSPSAITNTYNWNKNPGLPVTTGNYRRVTYNGLDTTVEHTFYVVFYGQNYIYKPNATILIPKSQDNENWEEVMFSATNTIGSAKKNIYIDGNSSTSGGTTAFYYRYLVGLPAGVHTGYTDYSNYNYCPSVSSETFTSVAGNSRVVNFEYNYLNTKTLYYTLVDTSGNTITNPPNDAVHYSWQGYNDCGVSITATDYSFPVNITVKSHGSFTLSNSSNRHYIYGYTPPTLGTRYYVDDYQSTFDIVYTKLDEEAVTITYTTYDPTDTEIPSFETNITYPYNGGTTSATTLQSFNVPYTYTYVTEQTSDKFSAISQSNTAGQASRTVTLTLYPNNRDFATVADLEAYAYAWEGMVATVNSTTTYKYTNGQWEELVFTEYEYIQTQGAAGKFYDFITNFYPTSSHTIETKIEFVTTSVDWGGIVGWNDGNNSHTFTLESATNKYQIIVRTDGNTSSSYRPTIGVNKEVVIRMPLGGSTGTYQITGGSVSTLIYNYSNYSLPANIGMCLFGRGTAVRRQGASARMFYTKVYDNNNNLVKHYVASDFFGTPCFYDKVDGEYVLDTYTGSDHGTCTLGNPVS